MRMISEQIENLKVLQKELFRSEKAISSLIVRDAINTIETLSAKVRANNLNGGWIPCSERLPEESLNSVIGWDAYRERCCFVHYLGGRWILGDDTETVKIIAWQPLPEPYREG